MRGSHGPRLPLLPLLRAYVAAGVPAVAELAQLPGLGSRFGAVLAARRDWLAERFVELAPEAEFQTALVRFYEACVTPALHVETVRRRCGFVRHGLMHLLRGRDPLPRKAERCLTADGPYHVAGLGPSFWSAVFQALDPHDHAAWTPAVAAGLRRLGLAGWQPQHHAGQVYAAVLNSYRYVRSLEPALTPLHVDHFLTLAAGMTGRDLWSGRTQAVDPTELVRRERAGTPLRRRLKERGRLLHDARRDFEAGLAQQDGPAIGKVLAQVDPSAGPRTAIDWERDAETITLWVGRLWEADDPDDFLESFWRTDPIPGAGLWLPAAVLHLRDPKRFPLWNEAVRRGYAVLDDGFALDGCRCAAHGYRLFGEGVAWLCDRHRVHPLEAADVLATLAGRDEPPEGRRTKAGVRFDGFCPDTFRFLEELAGNNQTDWMHRQRDRYRFVVREPLVELCRALAERYVEPVLRRQYGWDLETAAASGRALTSICKNDYGRTVPYHTDAWVAFYRRDRGGKRDDVQLFVQLDATGLRYGLRLGPDARAAGRLLRRNVQEHAELLYRALWDRGAFAECRFGDAGQVPAGPGDLRTWAAGKTVVAGKHVPADAALLTADELAGDVLLTFDRLLPAYACAVEADPVPFLTRQAGAAPAAERFRDADFCRATYLDAGWVRRARELLGLKRQLILQGVPGTGKTHVARCLARLLTGDRDGAVRLVQFHPAYGYEEFVEGIKVQSVEVDGRHDVTYPVEDGLLAAFAAEAARQPAEPFVLIVDEINRGNLPRVFGELLYLLEYRDQSVTLPYSKRPFRLPANLYLLGTMNAADRSVALIDQALRRRFSFLEMPPDAAVLAAWLRAHPPAGGPDFAAAVVALFERLNARLRADLGPPFQVGHSYFMVADLDEDRLRVVWEHHVRPLLEEYAAGRPDRLAGYELEPLLHGGGRKARRSTLVQRDLAAPYNARMFGMVNGAFPLFRVAGVAVYLHWTWLLLALLVFHVPLPFIQFESPWLRLLFFFTIFGIVLLHELGHALACRQVGGEAEFIVLWPLGGIAYVVPPPRPGAVLWSIAAGPLVNVLLVPLTAGLFAVSYFVQDSGQPSDVSNFLFALMGTNALLLIFNLLPIYPLDGGQILHALLWFALGRASSLLAVSILGLAGGLGLLGLSLLGLVLLRENGLGLLWVALVSGFMTFRSWLAFLQARTMVEIESAPRHPHLACPLCGTPPPHGAFWTCGHCRTRFDPFLEDNTCPECGTEFEETSCPECSHIGPLQDWSPERPAEAV